MTANERSWEERLRCTIDIEMKHFEPDDFPAIHAHLQTLLVHAIEKEVIDTYDICTDEPWREFIQLVHLCDDQLDNDPRDYMDSLPPDSTLRGRLDRLWTVQHPHKRFEKCYQSCPQELSFGIYVMREAENFWADYMQVAAITCWACLPP